MAQLVKNFLFYDIETTGLSKSFDQVLQFAAIRTDSSLRETGRHEKRIRLNPDMIPSPEAMLTHGLGIPDMLEGESEYEAIQEIHQWLNTPNTLSLGYNTLGFDDEFLRFSFYRNLLSPYTHQYANGCGRMDLFPITVMFYLFGNDILQWPEKNEGISLKLADLNAANLLHGGKAHDAMADTEATLALARRFFQQTDMWGYLAGHFEKKTDLLRMQPLQQAGMTALMIQPIHGYTNRYQCPVVFMGKHLHYQNQLLWLRLDTETLQDTTPESIAETTWSISTKPGEPDFVLPFPSRFDRHLSPERKALAEQNHQWLTSHPELFQKIRAQHAHFKWPVYPDVDCEAGLYVQGFFSPEEERFCMRFHAATPAKKAGLAEQPPTQRMGGLATRLVARHFPDHMTSLLTERHAAWQKAMRADDGSAPVDFRGKKRLTSSGALQTINALLTEKSRGRKEKALLKEAKKWLAGNAAP